MSVFTFTVTSHLDSPTATAGDGTLRGEILAANAVGAGNSAIIDFNIEGTGVQTIVLAGIPLPTIDVPTVINGRSQGGVSYTGPPKIAISGVAVANANGITLDSNAAGSTIEGLSIVGFVASTRSGMLMKGARSISRRALMATSSRGTISAIFPAGTLARLTTMASTSHPPTI
jgi:hypothetical protein